MKKYRFLLERFLICRRSRMAVEQADVRGSKSSLTSGDGDVGQSYGTVPVVGGETAELLPHVDGGGTRPQERTLG